MLINPGGLTGYHDRNNIHQLNLQPYGHHPRHLKQSDQLHLLHGSGGLAERRRPHCPDPSPHGGLSPKALLLNGLSSLLSSPLCQRSALPPIITT